MTNDTLAPIGEDIAELRVQFERTREAQRKMLARGVDTTADYERGLAEAKRRKVAEAVTQVVPRRYLEATTDQDEIRKFEAALAGGRGLILTGPVGTGKTHSVCALLRHYIEKDGRPSSAEFHGVGRLLSRLRPNGSENAQALDRLGSLNLLVLDDLGSHGDSEWVQEQLFIMLDTRYQDKRTTLITTNVRPAEFVDTFGEALAGRLFETCEIVQKLGADRRMSSRGRAA